MNVLRIREMLHAALCLLLLSASVGAHSGGPVYPVPYLTDGMLADIRLADGSVDEWYDLVGEPTMTPLGFEDGSWGPGLDPADLDFGIWLAWHDDPARLYLAVAVSDDLYKNTYVPGYPDELDNWMLFQDNIILGIDADHSGGEGFDGNPDWGKVDGKTQVYMAIAHASGGPPMEEVPIRWETPWTILPPYAEAGGGTAGESPVISVTELYVTPFDSGAQEEPENGVVSDLQSGKVIGFGILLSDWDRSEIATGWAPEPMVRFGGELPAYAHLMQHRADAFIDGILLSPDPAGPGTGTAAEPVSWGRIKASLEMD